MRVANRNNNTPGNRNNNLGFRLANTAPLRNAGLYGRRQRGRTVQPFILHPSGIEYLNAPLLVVRCKVEAGAAVLGVLANIGDLNRCNCFIYKMLYKTDFSGGTRL